jgi:hypothetical protein
MWNRLSALPMKTQTKAWSQRGQQEFGASMCGLSYIQAVNIRAITDPGSTLAIRGGRGSRWLQHLLLGQGRGGLLDPANRAATT